MTTTAARLLSEQLTTFFDAYAETRAPEKPSLSGWLTDFFDSFSHCRSKVEISKKSSPTIDPEALEAFLIDLEKPLIASRQAVLQFDPWEVAGLGYDEVRNTGVLAWLLNPRGSHGLGLAAMNSLLDAVNHHFSIISFALFPAEPGRYCFVQTEINPNGEIYDRVDIEIDTENFYLIVEAKIRAPEGKGQIERYCKQAELRAGKRCWAVIFLTPEGYLPNLPSNYKNCHKVIPLSWRNLAAFMEHNFFKNSSMPTQDLPFSYFAAEQSVTCFVKKIRLF